MAYNFLPCDRDQARLPRLVLPGPHASVQRGHQWHRGAPPIGTTNWGNGSEQQQAAYQA
jgi:hypothetical protein